MKLHPLHNLDAKSPMYGRRILIIEDDNYVREAFELTLKSSGLDALVVTTAEEGMEAVRKQSFDVIISDYRLPGMNGIDFFTLAESFISCATKVLISAYGFDDISYDAKAVGVDHLFIKPFSIQQLLNRLDLDARPVVNYYEAVGESR